MSIIKMNSEQKLIGGEIRKFTTAELDPIATDIEKNCLVPPEIIKKLSQMGLFGFAVPEEYGGPGLNMTTLCVALEELSKSSASLALMVAVNNSLVAGSIAEFGSPQIKEKYLRLISNGSIGGFVQFVQIEIAGHKFIVKDENGATFMSGKSDIVYNSIPAEFFVIPVAHGKGMTFCIVDKSDSSLKTYPVRTMGMCAAGITGLASEHTKLVKEDITAEEMEGMNALHSL
ncbi:MAG: acyl-CoA dehydrogenase family protein, partial [candidate division WOR-3 bacterium]